MKFKVKGEFEFYAECYEEAEKLANMLRQVIEEGLPPRTLILNIGPCLEEEEDEG